MTNNLTIEELEALRQKALSLMDDIMDSDSGISPYKALGHINDFYLILIKAIKENVGLNNIKKYPAYDAVSLILENGCLKKGNTRLKDEVAQLKAEIERIKEGKD